MSTPSKIPTLLVRIKQAAAALRISESSIKGMIADGRIEALRIGPRTIRIDWQELLRVTREAADKARAERTRYPTANERGRIAAGNPIELKVTR